MPFLVNKHRLQKTRKPKFNEEDWDHLFYSTQAAEQATLDLTVLLLQGSAVIINVVVSLFDFIVFLSTLC